MNYRMIRVWLAERVLDYLQFSLIQRGKYRVAQLAHMILSGTPVRSKYGPKLHARFLDSSFWLAARYGNDQVIGLLSDLSSSDAFIDVGANIGLTTCFAAPVCAAVLSLEASSRELADLIHNCTLLSGVVRPTCILAAAADVNGFLPFNISHISHSVGNSLALGKSTESRCTFVWAVRIDELLNDDSLASWPAMHSAWRNKRLVVKIDVEGFESLVLQGMPCLLREQRCRKVIVEVNDQRMSSLDITFDVDSYMASFGYVPSVHPSGREHFDQCYILRR